MWQDLPVKGQSFILISFFRVFFLKDTPSIKYCKWDISHEFIIENLVLQHRIGVLLTRPKICIISLTPRKISGTRRALGRSGLTNSPIPCRLAGGTSGRGKDREYDIR